MKKNSRIHLCAFASLVGAALAPHVAGSPFADSAAGVGTYLGNSQGPVPNRTRDLDREWPVAKHTPTGQLFKLPFAIPDIRKAASGWEYSGQLELGVIGGDADERNAQLRTYQDIDNGFYLNNFSLQMRKPEGRYTAELVGGGAGQHDQYYGLQFGRANAWKVKAFYNEIPHVFTDRYKPLWSGIETGNPTLLPPLTPGGTASTLNDNANVAATATASGNQTVSLIRKRGGVRLDMDFSTTWKGYISYALEKREGARPLGAVWGNNPGTAPIEIVEPIDYATTDLLAGVMHASGLNAFNLRVSASLFKNDIGTLTFQEPYRIAPPAGVTTVPAAGAYTEGHFDLYPDNDAYNVRAEYTRKFPEFMKSYLTAVASWGTWRQDDNLVPYTNIPGLALTNVTTLPGGAWNTIGALSRQTADTSIDTRHADLTFSFNPSSALNLKLKGRYYETANNTDPYLAVNPNAVYVDADGATAGNQTRGLTLNGVTGVWGRLLNDGSGQSVLYGANANPAGNVAIKSTPFASEQFRYGATGDYRLNKVSNLNAAIERETNERENRERDETWEDRFKLGYVNRGIGNSSARLSYEYGKRRGSDYVTSTYDDAFSAALVPIPTTPGTNVTSWAARTNSGFRAIDLADRDQHTVNVRIDTMLRTNLDAGISLQGRKAQYPDSDYGLKEQNQRSANIDLNYQPSPRQNIYGFYAYQNGRIDQASNAGGGNITIGQVTALGVVTPENAVMIGQSPGGPIFPLLNNWTAISTDENHVFGVGLRQDIGKATLNVDYSYLTGRTRIEYNYTVGGAINAANAVFAGSRMPDMATDMNYLDASLRFPLSDRLSVRLLYHYQKEEVRDWHYQNLENNPVVVGNAANLPTAVILDGGRYNYSVNWYGVTLQIKL